MKELSNEILSDITVYNKYAKYLPTVQRRETWEELVHRNMNMHINHYPDMATQIFQVYQDFVIPKKVLPSMRSLQFGGAPIELAPNRIFNCAFMPVDSLECFSEMMFLLLGGTGGGFSVQSRHVSQLPVVLGPKDAERRYVIGG